MNVLTSLKLELELDCCDPNELLTPILTCHILKICQPSYDSNLCLSIDSDFKVFNSKTKTIRNKLRQKMLILNVIKLHN